MSRLLHRGTFRTGFQASSWLPDNVGPILVASTLGGEPSSSCYSHYFDRHHSPPEPVHPDRVGAHGVAYSLTLLPRFSEVFRAPIKGSLKMSSYFKPIYHSVERVTKKR